MTDLLELSPKAVLEMGVKRITPLVAKYGITSPEVFAACERWGGMLDEVNYPDSSCRWCGVAVTHAFDGQDGKGAYYHVDRKSKYCWDGAPAVATPADYNARKMAEYAKAYGATDADVERSKQFKLMGSTTGRMSNSNPDLSTIPGKPKKNPLQK